MMDSNTEAGARASAQPGTAEAPQADAAQVESTLTAGAEAPATRPGAEEAVQRVKYPPLKEENVSAPLGNIDYLKDVNLEASVELGDTHLSVEKILNLGVGAVVELAQNVGEPVRLLINHNLYAMGEVVVIGDKFGIRITKLVRGA